jgi:hypothetical protein
VPVVIKASNQIIIELFSGLNARQFAKLIRQLGAERILFGVDGLSPTEAWDNFRQVLPLEEARMIIARR